LDQNLQAKNGFDAGQAGTFLELDRTTKNPLVRDGDCAHAEFTNPFDKVRNSNNRLPQTVRRSASQVHEFSWL